jgi:hypothetical protein
MYFYAGSSRYLVATSSITERFVRFTPITRPSSGRNHWCQITHVFPSFLRISSPPLSKAMIMAGLRRQGTRMGERGASGVGGWHRHGKEVESTEYSTLWYFVCSLFCGSRYLCSVRYSSVRMYTVHTTHVTWRYWKVGERGTQRTYSTARRSARRGRGRGLGRERDQRTLACIPTDM